MNIPLHPAFIDTCKTYNFNYAALQLNFVRLNLPYIVEPALDDDPVLRFSCVSLGSYTVMRRSNAPLKFNPDLRRDLILPINTIRYRQLMAGNNYKFGIKDFPDKDIDIFRSLCSLKPDEYGQYGAIQFYVNNNHFSWYRVVVDLERLLQMRRIQYDAACLAFPQ